MTPRRSLRAAARDIYGEMAKGEVGSSHEPPPSLSLPHKGGGNDSLQASPGVGAETDLTARVRGLYEDTAVPVAEIARLCGVTERTIYKYVERHDWRRRYRTRGAAGGRVPCRGYVAPAKGAGGRFIRRADIGKPFARGLKATDPAGCSRALFACAKASRIAGAAQARAQEHRRQERLARAIEATNRALADFRRYRERLGNAKPTPLQAQIGGLLIRTVELSLRPWHALQGRD